RFATADPEVQITAAGTRDCLPIPSAVNPATRSSRRTCNRIRPCRSSSAAARASACEREPGLTMTWRTPRATSRSRTSQAASLLAVIVVCVVVLVGLLGVRHVERLLHVEEGDLFFQLADP